MCRSPKIVHHLLLLIHGGVITFDIILDNLSLDGQEGSCSSGNSPYNIPGGKLDIHVHILSIRNILNAFIHVLVHHMCSSAGLLLCQYFYCIFIWHCGPCCWGHQIWRDATRLLIAAGELNGSFAATVLSSLEDMDSWQGSDMTVMESESIDKKIWDARP